MRRLLKGSFSSLLLMLLLFTGCNSQPEPARQKSQAPSWILNPNQNGKIGAVGSAMRTYDQKLSTQRKLAITRALDELSLQTGVKVKMVMLKEENYNSDRGSSKMDIAASYKTDGVITAHIESVYQDRASGELFVWMVMN